MLVDNSSSLSGTYQNIENFKQTNQNTVWELQETLTKTALAPLGYNYMYVIMACFETSPLKTNVQWNPDFSNLQGK